MTVTDGVPVPVRFREKIRADKGPTIPYGEAESPSWLQADGAR